MNCPNCQGIVPPDDFFCSYCGAELYPGQPAILRWTIYAAVLVAVILVGAGILSFVFFGDSVTELAGQDPIIGDFADRSDDSEVQVVPEESRASLPAPTSTPTPAPTAAPTRTPIPTEAPEPTPTITPTVRPTPTPTPLPTPMPVDIFVAPNSGPPDTRIAVYGEGFQPFSTVELVTFADINEGLRLSSERDVDEEGNLYFSLSAPYSAQGSGTYLIAVHVAGEVAYADFRLTDPPEPHPTPVEDIGAPPVLPFLFAPDPPPTSAPEPTVTPTPMPTRVPRVLQHARHAGAHYTITVPSGWRGGDITYFARSHTGPPAAWAQYNTIVGARRYDIRSLKDAGVNLVGTYFKERYSSDQICGDRGFVVIRETALLVGFPEVGIALHIDVCEADLFLEAEAGLTNEAISNEIIRSLRLQN